jgi:hypothetical protein
MIAGFCIGVLLVAATAGWLLVYAAIQAYEKLEAENKTLKADLEELKRKGGN